MVNIVPFFCVGGQGTDKLMYVMVDIVLSFFTGSQGTYKLMYMMVNIISLFIGGQGTNKLICKFFYRFLFRWSCDRQTDVCNSQSCNN